MKKPTEKTIGIIRSIFEQGDNRYYDPDNVGIVAFFVENNGINIREIPVGGGEYMTDKKVPHLGGAQQEYKKLAKMILEEKGYIVNGYEIIFKGLKPDVLAVHPIKKDEILVECCSCSYNKAIVYLERDGVTL